MAEMAWICFAACFGMSIVDANAPRRKSGKIALFVAFLGGSFLFYSYQGVLVSHLTVSTESSPFNSPEELLTTDYQ